MLITVFTTNFHYLKLYYTMPQNLYSHLSTTVDLSAAALLKKNPGRGAFPSFAQNSAQSSTPGLATLGFRVKDLGFRVVLLLGLGFWSFGVQFEDRS